VTGACSQLRVLKVQNYEIELSSVLQICSGLTALDLQNCSLREYLGAPVRAAAIAALPQLRSLRLAQNYELFESTQLQLPSQLTHLCLECDPVQRRQSQITQLGQLSGLVNLQHLQLVKLHPGVPGGLPSQLVKLTCLDVHYWGGFNATEQLQHLSCFTALQQLSVRGSAGPDNDWTAGDVSGTQHLTQLTSLELQSYNLDFTSASTSSWACLTALQSLTLRSCKMQPEALARLTQLRSLSLHHVAPIRQVQQQPPSGPVVFEPAASELLFAAVSQLPLLTQLQVAAIISPPWGTSPPSAAVGSACTALTVSTRIASLQLSLSSTAADGCHLFNAEPRALYPDLRLINLLYSQGGFTVPLGEQQLELLCSCCPAVESLSFKVPSAPAATPMATGLLALLRLSALTHLVVSAGGAAGGAAVVDATAQLTGLKQLQLWLPYVQGTCEVSSDTLMQLTALTALEQLRFDDHRTSSDDDGFPELHLQNKASRCGVLYCIL
jgi:hypothetical protein